MAAFKFSFDKVFMKVKLHPNFSLVSFIISRLKKSFEVYFINSNLILNLIACSLACFLLKKLFVLKVTQPEFFMYINSTLRLHLKSLYLSYKNF